LTKKHKLRGSFRNGSGDNNASGSGPSFDAIVKFLARRAADEDFQRLLAKSKNQFDKKEEPKPPWQKSLYTPDIHPTFKPMRPSRIKSAYAKRAVSEETT